MGNLGLPPNDSLRRSRALRFVAGKTITEIADEDGCSPQAVQQMLAKLNMGRFDGGKHVSKGVPRQERMADCTLNYSMRTYGVPWSPENAERIKALRAAGLTHKYTQWKSNCNRDSRPHSETLFEWVERMGHK